MRAIALLALLAAVNAAHAWSWPLDDLTTEAVQCTPDVYQWVGRAAIGPAEIACGIARVDPRYFMTATDHVMTAGGSSAVTLWEFLDGRAQRAYLTPTDLVAVFLWPLSSRGVVVLIVRLEAP